MPGQLDRCAISVQLAKVTNGQSRLLQVSQVACSAIPAGMICPIPKLIVLTASRTHSLGFPTGSQEQANDAGLPGRR